MAQTGDRSIIAPQRGGARVAACPGEARVPRARRGECHRPARPPGRWMRIGAALLALTVAGCEQEVETPPPALPLAARAEVQEPGGADFNQALPITAEDVGDLVMASGVVVGNPGPEGFFLLTEGGQVILVRSPEPAMGGQLVRAVGPVRQAQTAVFEGWERDLLGGIDPAWELVRLFYIESSRVVSIEGP